MEIKPVGNIQEYIGVKIKALRVHHKMSQADLAKKLDVSDSIISGYERGVRTPSMDVLFNICHIFDVSPDYFFKIGIRLKEKLTIDVSDLTDSQYKIVSELVNEFISINKEGK